MIKERVSDLHYKLLERVVSKNNKSVKFKLSGPVHVNRLSPYTPLPDGSPSVPNQPAPPRIAWSSPDRAPAVDDLVVVQTSAEWQDRPFDVGRVLHIVADGKESRYVLQWYGNVADDTCAALRPGYIDSKDNKRLFKGCKGSRFKPWTSSTTKTRVTSDNLLLVGVKLTRAGKLCADDLERLETCPHLHWSRPSRAMPSSLFE